MPNTLSRRALSGMGALQPAGAWQPAGALVVLGATQGFTTGC